MSFRVGRYAYHARFGLNTIVLPTMTSYILPSHPSITSLDPLSITEAENPTAWEVITTSISHSRTSTLLQLPALIEDLGYSLYGKGDLDTRFLRQFLARYSNLSETTTLLNEILDAALALPILFPTHEVPYISESYSALELTLPQIKSLISHQILGTLILPEGNTWGCTFQCWYSEPQPLEHAIRGYLATIFNFFHTSHLSTRSVLFEYCRGSSVQAKKGWQNYDTLIFEHLIIEPISASTVKFPHGTLNCMLISSNASPGFGASCTQEELITGACPALLPLGALLISPPVPHNAALIAQRIMPASSWKGQGREARLIDFLDAGSEYTFLLLDALELDLTDPLSFPDLDEHNLLRELQKAYTGLSALSARGINDIASPLWGAGAFGGDPIVKAIILAMAGAQAGVTVWISVDEAQTCPASADSPSSSKVIDILVSLKQKCADMTVGECYRQLTTDQARSCLDGQQLAMILR